MSAKWHRSKVTDQQRINLAGEYNKGRLEATPELGYPAMKLDEYVVFVESFRLAAMTLDRSNSDSEIEAILDTIGK